MPTGQSHISVSRINRKKRQKAEALNKQKPRPSLSRIAGRWGAEIAAFLLSSNIKIRRSKKFSRGLLKIYFS
jgi:hypothetical protein